MEGGRPPSGRARPEATGRIRVAVAARSAAARSAAAKLLAGIEGIEIVAELDGRGGRAEVPCEVVLYLLDEGESPYSVRAAAPLLLLGGPRPGQPPERSTGRLPPETEPSFLPRQCSRRELVAALSAVAAGLVVRRPGRAAPPVPSRPRPAGDAGAERPRGDWGSRVGNQLTARERQVLLMIAEGLPNKAIAAELGITSHTVKFHIASMMQKLGAASRTEAVTLGVRKGFIFL